MNIGAAATSGSPATSPATATQNSNRTSSLGQDAFLKLLITQLQHQDPTKPMNDTEFLSQLAQFSSLEKLTEISSSIKALERLLTDR